MIARTLLSCALVLLGGIAAAQSHQHGSPKSDLGIFNPFVVSDRQSGFFLAYVERRNGSSDVMLKHSPDGKVFEPAVRVNDKPGDAVVRSENPPKVATGPRGQVYVCWANERERWKGDIRFARSADGGKSFEPAITLNPDFANQPASHAFQSIAVGEAGRIYVSWIDERNKKESDRGAEIWMAISDDEGRTFTANRKIIGDVCECCRTSLQVDSRGRLYLSYRTVPPTGPLYRDISVARSDDGGKTFTSRIVHHDGWEINACPVAGPSLSIDSSDRLTVVWYTGGGKRPGLHYAVSLDGGESFTRKELPGSRGSLGKHAQIVTLSRGISLVAWDQSGSAPAVHWGVLDTIHHTYREERSEAGGAYPVVAANTTGVFVAGVLSDAQDLFLRFQSRKVFGSGRRK